MVNETIIASLSAIVLNKEMKAEICGTDLQMLEFIHKNQPVSESEIIRKLKLNKELADLILKNLRKNELSTSN